jgi:uncharacterized protein YceK
MKTILVFMLLACSGCSTVITPVSDSPTVWVNYHSFWMDDVYWCDAKASPPVCVAPKFLHSGQVSK